MLDEIRYFHHPDVRLIAAMAVNHEEVEDWGESRGFNLGSDALYDNDYIPELAGRLCYLSYLSRRPNEPGSTLNQTYLDHIYEIGHTSVIEHSVFGFMVTDVSRNYSHEQVRHRVGVAYSQLSTRYVDQFDNRYFDHPENGMSDKTLGAYMPPEVEEDEELKELYDGAWAMCQKVYHKIFQRMREKGLKLKQARSIAREILPGSAGTMIYITINARELDHIFKMRGALDADDQIRRVALAMYDCVREHNLFKGWHVAIDTEGRAYLRHDHFRRPSDPNTIGQNMFTLLGLVVLGVSLLTFPNRRSTVGRRLLFLFDLMCGLTLVVYGVVK